MMMTILSHAFQSFRPRGSRVHGTGIFNGRYMKLAAPLLLLAGLLGGCAYADDYYPTYGGYYSPYSGSYYTPRSGGYYSPYYGNRYYGGRHRRGHHRGHRY